MAVSPLSLPTQLRLEWTPVDFALVSKSSKPSGKLVCKANWKLASSQGFPAFFGGYICKEKQKLQTAFLCIAAGKAGRPGYDAN